MHPKDIAGIIQQKETILETVCSSRQCNIEVAREVHKRLDSIKCTPISYDGISHTDAQGFLIWDDHKIYVSYRGTATLSDIIDNIDIRRQKIYKSIIVHKGYFDKFMSMEEDITKDIKHIMKQYPITELVFTGHSMAASIASISSPYYGDMFKNLKITTHTLGSAPAGNIEFINWFSSNVDESVRIETEGDIVPYIPIHKDFIHIPNGIKIDNQGTVEVNYEIRPYEYSTILCLILKDWDRIYRDHSCETYISNLFATAPNYLPSK
jgi:hypothetical protein